MAAVKPIEPPIGVELSRDPDPNAELAFRFLHYLLMMREVEDRIERKLYRQGKILGGVYVGRGQEAIPVASGMVAEPDDVLKLALTPPVRTNETPRHDETRPRFGLA